MCLQTKDMLRAQNLASHKTLSDGFYLSCHSSLPTIFELAIAVWNSKGKSLTLRSDSQTQASRVPFLWKTPGHSPSERGQNFLFCLRSLACSLFHSDRVDKDTTCPPCVAELCWDDCIVSAKPLAERTVLSIIHIPPWTFHWSFQWWWIYKSSLKKTFLASFLLKQKIHKKPWKKQLKNNYLCNAHRAIIHTTKSLGSVILSFSKESLNWSIVSVKRHL